MTYNEADGGKANGRGVVLLEIHRHKHTTVCLPQSFWESAVRERGGVGFFRFNCFMGE